MTTVRLAGIAVVVLDLDDTLYPERQFAFSGFDAVGAWLRERTPCPTDPAQRMRELFDSGHRGRVFNRLLEEWGCNQTESWLPKMIECYRIHEPRISLYPDAAAAIERWGDSFQLSLISDGPVVMQRNKLKALGLASRFDPLILTDQWGESFRKPHRRAFDEIERTTAHAGPECVYIADNKSKDFVAPRQLGWRTVCVEHPEGIYVEAKAPDGGSPESEVPSFNDVKIG